MTPRISIAMGTFNGEKYLQEQLDSLATQTYPPCELVVGDDGSTDGTVAILEAFARRARFPVRIIRNAANLGFGENFLQTAAACSGDWIAFCDQDDVWLPHKLDRCAQAIGRHPRLNLILQNAELCDENLTARGRLSPNSMRPGIYKAGQLPGWWVWHGFLQTIRSALIRDVQFNDRPPSCSWVPPIQAHDQWTCTIANALGGVCVLAGSVALYRRHAGTITGHLARRGIREQIETVFVTGAVQYHIQSKRALDSAIVLRRVGERIRNKDWANAFRRSAALFDRFSEALSNRARLYESNGLVSRLRCFTSLWRMGGYVGPNFAAMGWRSALKDAAVTLVGGQRGAADHARSIN